jgi:hypothetical protein
MSLQKKHRIVSDKSVIPKPHCRLFQIVTRVHLLTHDERTFQF